MVGQKSHPTYVRLALACSHVDGSSILSPPDDPPAPVVVMIPPVVMGPDPVVSVELPVVVRSPPPAPRRFSCESPEQALRQETNAHVMARVRGLVRCMSSI